MQLYSETYIDKLLRAHTYDSLVELSSIISSCPQFDMTAPNYALPTQLFAFVEALSWFAMACRSGVITYFESTPIERQTAMLGALNACFPVDFASQYSFGIDNWRESSAQTQLDKWIDQNDPRNNKFLSQLIESNAIQFKRLLA